MKQRSATTLIELMLYLGFLGAVAGTVLTVAGFTTEERLRQQNIEAVEREGAQMIEAITRRLRTAELVTLPLRGETGSILSLVYGTAAADPVILAVSGTVLHVAEHDVIRRLSATGVAITDFVVSNTSTSAEQQSILLSFKASRIPGLLTSVAFTKNFETLVTLFPDHNISGDECGCAIPACTTNVLRWEVCVESSCSQTGVTLPC